MRRIAVDSNLLLLLVLGSTRRDLVGSHKCLRTYCFDDLVLLRELLDGAILIATPNAWTEVSNLARQGLRDPLRTTVGDIVGFFISEFTELTLDSGLAAKEPEFA